MEEPDTSGDEDQTQKQVTQATAEPDSDESYSDSDSDEVISPKSLYSVYKVSHVPGKYKQNLKQQPYQASAVPLGTTETKNQEQYENYANQTEQNTQEQHHTIQLAHQTQELNFAETGIFGKSMLVIPSMRTEEIQKETKIAQSKSNPPISPKPSKPPKQGLAISMPADEEATSLPPVVKWSPIPAPRKAKRELESTVPIVTEEKIVLAEEPKPLQRNSPSPSPRDTTQISIMQSSSSTAYVGTGKEAFKPYIFGARRTELKDDNTETNENTCVPTDAIAHTGSLIDADDIDGIEQSKSKEDDNADTNKAGSIPCDTDVDIAASDSTSDAHGAGENIISEEGTTVHSLASDSFDFIHTSEIIKVVDNTSNIEYELHDAGNRDEQSNILLQIDSADITQINEIPTDESSEKFSDAIKTSLLKSIVDDSDTDISTAEVKFIKHIGSDSDMSYNTPDDHSDMEDLYEDCNPGESMNRHDIADENQENETQDCAKAFVIEDSNEESTHSNARYSKNETDDIPTAEIFDESFIFIRRGTVKEGYESLSSTVCSGELSEVTFPSDPIETYTQECVSSVRDRISMFENLEPETNNRVIATNEESQSMEIAPKEALEMEKNMNVTKSNTSSSSFVVLSRCESKDSNLNTASEISESSNRLEVLEEKADHKLEHNLQLPSSPKTDAAQDCAQSMFSVSTVNSQMGPGLGATSQDTEETTEDKVAPHVEVEEYGIKSEATDKNFIQHLALHQDQSMADQQPPPLAPKSKHVLESMKSYVTVGEYQPDVPPRSLVTELQGPLFVHNSTGSPKHVNEQVTTNIYAAHPGSAGNVSSGQCEHIPTQPPASEYSTQSALQHHGYNQQHGHVQQHQQIPPNLSMQYPQTQQSAGWNQPYYSTDERGHQYMNPYACYNPNMGQGMFYQHQSLPYYQQPYFPYNPSMNQYIQPPYGDAIQMSHPQTSTEDTYQSYEEAIQTQQTPKQERPTAHQNPQTRKHAHNQNEDSDGHNSPEHDKTILRLSKSDGAIKTAKRETLLVSVGRSRSIATDIPREGLKSKDEKHSLKLKEEIKEERVKEVAKVVDHYIYFKGVNPETRRENLANFVEITTTGTTEPDKIVFNYSKTCAVVTISIDRKPDLEAVKARIQKKGIDTKRPDVYEVPPPVCIAVSSDDDINNTESLGLYFESPKSGGDELMQEPYESEDGSCFVVQFTNAEVAKRVCERKTIHVWSGKTLRVSPYYQSEAGAIWDSELHVVKIPQPIVVKLEPMYLRFIQMSCCEELLSSLKSTHCIPSFSEQGLELECTLTPKTASFKSLVKAWEDSCRNSVYKYLEEKVTERQLMTGDGVWDELMQFFNSENIRKTSDLLVEFNNQTFGIFLVGFHDSVKAEFETLDSKYKEIGRRLKRVSETIKFDVLKLRLLDTIGVLEEVRQEMEDIEIYVGDGEITIKGQPEDVSSVKMEMYEETSVKMSYAYWKHGFSKECVEFVQRKLTDKISSSIKNKGITAEWKIDVREVTVLVSSKSKGITPEENVDDLYCYANVNDVGTNAIHFLKSVILEKREKVTDDVIEALTSPEWSLFLENITETYEDDAELEFKDSIEEILMYGMKKEVQEIHKQVKVFIEDNSIKENKMTCGTINVRFIKMHRNDLIGRLEKKFEHLKVKIALQDECVVIRGTKDGIAAAKKDLKVVFDGIIWEKHSIQKVAVKDVFRDETEQGTIAVVEKETRCLVKLPGERETFYNPEEVAEDIDDVHTLPRGATVAAVAAQGYTGRKAAAQAPSFKAPNGVKVTLVKGELGQQDGDVIVVSTAPNLNLSSGNACKSLLRAGGQRLQDECKQKYPNEIKYGELAVIHGAGSLECNRVYLTSLPNWTSESNSKQLLQTIMKDSLELASKHQKHSILFSAMGTGQLKYPTDVVAMVMYQAVIDFDQSNAQTTLNDVKFVLYQKDYPTIKAFEEEERLRLEGNGNRPTYDLKAGSITIELSVENIAEQKVGGVLCSTSASMDLSRSGACQALLRAGGKTLQDECQAKYNNHLDAGQVVEIGSGKLPCTSVFLTLLPAYSADAIDMLSNIIQTLLSTAQAKNMSSIAIPALGTGYLKYPKDDVCRCMFQTVIDWSQKNTSTCVKTVRFIMHAKDHEVIQRFKTYILNAHGRGTRKGRSFAKDPSTLPKTTKLGPQCKSIFNAHSNGVQIGNITLNVFKDDILAQKTDVIVSTVGKKFEFIGAVANELKTKHPEVAAECHNKEQIQKLRSDGVVLTKCVGLPAKRIIHVKYVESLSDWQQQMYRCLEKANKKSYKTIAFPVIGTGKGFTSFNPDAIAGCLFDAVTQFVKCTRTPCINEVRLIVYRGQPTMYTPIMDKLFKKVQEAAMSDDDDGSLTKITKGIKKLWSAVTGNEEGRMSAEDRQKLMEETSSLEVHIYSDSKNNIAECIKALDAKLEKAYAKKKIENYKEIIKSLTPEETKELDVIALADIKIDSNGGIITIEGPIKSVSDVAHELQMTLLQMQRRRHTITAVEELHKLVQWQYEEVTQTEFKLTPYSKHINHKIEQAYKDNEPTFEFEDDDGDKFVIDFQRLEEFRKTDETDCLRVLRKDILKSAASALPGDWAQMKDNETIKVVSLPATDQTYKDIENRFLTEVKTGSYAHRLNFDPKNLKVNKIERIQNKTLYQQYQAKQKHMTEQKPNLPANMPIERELWHGTKNDAVTSIQMHGFNRSYSGNANGDPWYGEGVYFAANASYSARGWLSGAGSGSKGYMFLVKTLSGQFCKGAKRMRYLPAVDAKDPTLLFDCAVDDIANPMEFVIFNDTQAYPAYIITFTT